jgi:hypothetical protein
MNTRTKEVYTIADIYSNRVLLKENTNWKPTPEQLKQIKNVFKSFYELPEFEEKAKQLENFKPQVNENQSYTESYLSEGLGSRISSSISGAKDWAFGKRGSGGESNIQSLRVQKRYDTLKNKIGSHLKELQRDLKTTSGADNTVKQEVDKMINSLESEHGIKPTESKLQDIRHGLGRGVEWATKAAGLGAIGAALGTAVGGLAGATGLTAAALKGATALAFRKAANDLIKGQKPKAKDIALQAAIGAVMGVGAGYIADHYDEIKNMLGIGDSAQPENVPASLDTPTQPEAGDLDTPTQPEAGIDNAIDPKTHFPKFHDSPFNPKSPLDQAKLSFDNELLNRDLVGQGNFDNGPSPAIIKAASDAKLNPDQYKELANRIKNLSQEELDWFKGKLSSDPDRISKVLIKYLIGK